MATHDNAGPSNNATRMDRGTSLTLDPYHISTQNTVHRKPHLATHDEPAHPALTSIAEGVPISQTYSSQSETGGDSSTLASQGTDEHGRVRTLPIWIESFEVSDLQGLRARAVDGLLAAPPQAHSAHHHYYTNAASPGRRRSKDGYVSEEEEDAMLARIQERGIFGTVRDPARGRKWDHARNDEPVVISKTVQSQSPWVINLVKSSMYGPAANEDRYQATEEYLQNQTPGYFKPWRGEADEEKAEGLLHSRKEQRALLKRVQVCTDQGRSGYSC